MTSFNASTLSALGPLPDGGNIAPGRYAVRSSSEVQVGAFDDKPKAAVWFKTSPLSIQTILKMKQVQLVAESHDQGFAEVPSAGNWTWLEVAILANLTASQPKVVAGVEMVWTSHYNNFMSHEFSWAEGKIFDRDHGLLKFLEEGNVIAVRICARFPGWTIFVKNGHLLVDISSEEATFDAEPPRYEEVVADTMRIHDLFTQVNLQTGQTFIPSLPEGMFRAESFEVGSDRPLRVLSLDGGGVRGLAALKILDAVMKNVHGGKKPCEVFDMIGGTSTGGFIAIMLGRLRMDIESCMKKYNQFNHDIFDTGKLSKIWNFGKNGDQYDPKTLENAIKQVVKEQLGDENALLREKGDPQCKVFVLATRRDAANNRGPVFLRSYQNPQAMSDMPDIPIWKAARATSAAPSYFPPMRIGDHELIDGGMQANNPLGWLWTEVLGNFGPKRDTSCFLSIGTGMPANQALSKFGIIGSVITPNSSEKELSSIATNTEIINILFQAIIDAYAPLAGARKYWRLNVATKVEGKDDFQAPGSLDDTVALKKFLVQTDAYIEANAGVLLECAKALSEKS